MRLDLINCRVVLMVIGSSSVLIIGMSKKGDCMLRTVPSTSLTAYQAAAQIDMSIVCAKYIYSEGRFLNRDCAFSHVHTSTNIRITYLYCKQVLAE